jgi:hypothetical protein
MNNFLYICKKNSMKKWNNEEMISLVKEKTGLEATVQNNEAAGHFTDDLFIKVGEDLLNLGGFIEEGEISDTTNTEIEKVYLCDSEGNGLNSREPQVRKAYFEIKDSLTDLGYEVVDNFRDYF